MTGLVVLVLKISEAPVPPDHVKTVKVKCPEECPSNCTQCAEKRKNLKDTKEMKEVGSNECVLNASILGYEIPPNCLKFLKLLYVEMLKLEEAKKLKAEEQEKGVKEEKQEQEEGMISVKEEIAPEVEVKEEPKEEIEKVEVKEEVEEPQKEEPQKVEVKEEPQKEEEPQKVEVKEEPKEEIETIKEEKQEEAEVAEQKEKVDEISEETEKLKESAEEKIEDSAEAEKADEEQQEKEVKEEKYVEEETIFKEEKSKKRKSKTVKGASEDKLEKKDDKIKTLNKGCMCNVEKEKQQKMQQPASFLRELSCDINKILTKKPQKMKSCGCENQQRTDVMSQIREKLSSDQSGLGDLYLCTRGRQKQIETSQDSKPCCNKRLSYGYSLDNQLKEFEDKKVNSADVLKMFVEDISNDIKAMKSTLYRGLCGRKSDKSRSSNGQISDHSFPASIRSVRPLGSKALLVTWIVHSFFGLAGYEIWVDDCCKTRLHASGYDSGCVYSVDVTKRHLIVLHPIPTEDYMKKRQKPCACLMCTILPNFSEPKKTPPLPESWTPSTYIYDPYFSRNSDPSNSSNDDGPCCCV